MARGAFEPNIVERLLDGPMLRSTRDSERTLPRVIDLGLVLPYAGLVAVFEQIRNGRVNSTEDYEDY